MALKTITINSIWGGQQQTYYSGGADTYLASLGIDPDLPVNTAGLDERTSGAIVPVAYTKFSSTNISGYPKWIVTNIKDTKIYVYASDGKFVSYTSALGSETLVGTPTSGAGNGAAYYNNYIYLATPTDISRYGPLDGTPSLANTVWTSTWSLTALTNTTYPSLRGTPMPNHPMHVHGDNALYLGDVSAGQGIINKIITSKTTNEGDTDNGSAYNSLDLPFGFIPTDIESWGTDLVIAATQTTDTTVNQGKAALFFWDPTDTDTFYRGPMFLPDPIVSALININGVLWIFTGNASNGVRVSRYIGGNSISKTGNVYLEEGQPPLAGAVDALGNRVVWGGYSTYPESSACVWALGSKRPDVPAGLHNVVKTTSTGATQSVTALKYALQSSNISPRVIAGWGDDSAKGIDKYSAAATQTSVWRSKVINIGQAFQLKRIRVPLSKAVAANMTFTPKVYIDEESTTVTLTTVNNTNYASSERKIDIKARELKSAQGKNNFFIEFNFDGTVQLPITFPIIIDVDVFEDEP
ncbi:hypothetical protein CL633_04600 [bacterium]|jgi:hypothetical protein|nr:hypothetical protein [bacterium]|tara:strand:+ start:14121 stop:15695 length:1575 start_codon:yes stop_codon:yes gene_type:complete